MADAYFTAATFDFLTALAANNNRDWFDEHRQGYEDNVRTPALKLISDMVSELPAISPHFVALPKKSGGSLMRVHRDVRFGKSKLPYKTNIGIQFRHEIGKDVHAPGYYIHIAPDGCFIGAGVWQPDATALGKIRDAIIEHGDAWVAARNNAAFTKRFELSGSALTNPPRGYPKTHPLLEDLKRKDFIAIAALRESTVTSKNFISTVVSHFNEATPLMAFLCKALALRF